ncbi:roadblock/LC7 domain-containing protein [Streptomyces sp. KM273126]|uniref:roadblock/LC7 domain-containing protein n=1 Tax=Streptomyces sp. KM273126 TaxID=2545247 RepID=UPI0015ECA8EA|nr:roadblock/LC7 domain-containing protein [Streptomyces sp. KM273126]
MAAEAEVLDELRRLRARVPQLTGALAASVDGLVLAQDTPGVEPEGVAALTAAVLGVAVRMTDATGQGDFRELLVRGTQGYVATYAAGSSAVLTLLAEDRVNVGRLHLEGRRAGTRIGELVDAAAARAEPPPRSAAARARNQPSATSRPEGEGDRETEPNSTPNSTPSSTPQSTPHSAPSSNPSSNPRSAPKSAPKTTAASAPPPTPASLPTRTRTTRTVRATTRPTPNTPTTSES